MYTPAYKSKDKKDALERHWTYTKVGTRNEAELGN